MRENSKANGLAGHWVGGMWVFLQLLIETYIPGPTLRHTGPEFPEWSCHVNEALGVVYTFITLKGKNLARAWIGNLSGCVPFQAALH